MEYKALAYFSEGVNKNLSRNLLDTLIYRINENFNDNNKGYICSMLKAAIKAISELITSRTPVETAFGVCYNIHVICIRNNPGMAIARSSLYDMIGLFSYALYENVNYRNLPDFILYNISYPIPYSVNKVKWVNCLWQEEQLEFRLQFMGWLYVQMTNMLSLMNERY